MALDVKTFIKSLTTRPGVYQMLDKHQKVLYVGKAKNLKRRINSYFRKNIKDPKTIALIAKIADIKIIITRTENEALILENNLIKKHHPPYNIIFRDDKSYPYILISEDKFPSITPYRGKRSKKGKYFGPYPSAAAMHETLNLLQKLFHIRSCKNSFFNNRSRPCLQYQIKRCSAPCVKFITQSDYAKDIQNAILFLQGKSDIIIQQLEEKMEQATKKLQFETAAIYRDQIQNLRETQSQQYVSSQRENTDVIAVAENNGFVCIYILLIRYGRILGNKSFFQKLPLEEKTQTILTTFITQYYLSNNNEIPSNIILCHKITNLKTLQQIIASQTNKSIKMQCSVRGIKKKWQQIAKINAQESLNTYLLSKANLHQRFSALQQELKLHSLPKRLECFDVSHTMGEATVASCVVFDQNGPIKNDYRKFNITNITPGDDIAAMYQALKRRFKSSEKKLPDILIIDGGKTQLKQAEKVLNELKISEIIILAIAKGITRKPGWETIFMLGQSKPINLPPDSYALHLIQQIRDEAHRFAITAHRARRAKSRKKSSLENIPGIGMKRRQMLLKHFGGLQGILKASVEDLAKTPNISQQLAQKIYDNLH
ncbi:MAG: excinuclease ABC subunit UvrC [Gammaproteobacteria bacterium]|jgi:excinuclease ABC subunit C